MSLGLFFLSLNLPTHLTPVVGVAGLFRASQVAVNSLFACHALRPRQVCGSLTYYGYLDVGFRRCDNVPTCNYCFEAGLLERSAASAYGLRSSLCMLLEARSAFRFSNGRYLSWLRATLGIGRLVRPFHSFLSF
jgi:hypothetical protein